MKKFIIDNLINYIKNNKNCSNDEIEIIRYGISNLYLQISKMIVITSIAVILNIFKPYIIFIIFYNIIRMTSFGIHANKSYQCWISSLIIFIIIPYLINYINFNFFIKLFISLLTTIYIFIYSPADTKKRPIVSSKRRKIYKYLSTTLSLAYSVIFLYIKDQIIANALIFSLILQCIIISPITYKIFNQPYDNYKEYLRKENIKCLQES